MLPIIRTHLIWMSERIAFCFREFTLYHVLTKGTKIPSIGHGVKGCVSENRQRQGWRWGKWLRQRVGALSNRWSRRAGWYARLGVNAGLLGGTL